MPSKKTTLAKISTKTSAAKSSNAKSQEVTFEFFAPDARVVAVTGTWNNWKQDEIKLKKAKDGKWKTAVALKPGRYEYKFVVDGSWQNDQNSAEIVGNPFGSGNCVLLVR